MQLADNKRDVDQEMSADDLCGAGRFIVSRNPGARCSREAVLPRAYRRGHGPRSRPVMRRYGPAPFLLIVAGGARPRWNMRSYQKTRRAL